MDFEDIVAKTNEQIGLNLPKTSEAKAVFFGRNLIQLLITCPVSDLTIALSGLSETIPFINMFVQYHHEHRRGSLRDLGLLSTTI